MDLGESDRAERTIGMPRWYLVHDSNLHSIDEN